MGGVMSKATAANTRKLKVVPSPGEAPQVRGFPAQDVDRLMRAKLEGSGIDAATARKAGFRALNGAAITKLRVRRHGAGVLIPYRDMAGQDTAYWRLRYLPEGPMGEDDKEQKYASPPGAAPQAYFPPGLDWAAIAKDPQVPIIVTEGEFKAMCGAARTSSSSWRPSTGGGAPSPCSTTATSSTSPRSWRLSWRWRTR
jgi:hypothetical protein